MRLLFITTTAFAKMTEYIPEEETSDSLLNRLN